MQVVDAILFWANATPARPAIIQPHGVQTYRMLADAIMAAAGHFARLELDPAKPVAVSIGDPARMLIASLGLMHAGFSVVPVSQGLLQHLPLTGADTLVSEHGGAVWTDHTTILFNDAWTSARARRPESGAVAPPAGRDGDVILFTSGSTGRPRMTVFRPEMRAERVRCLLGIEVVSYERALVAPSLASAFGFDRTSTILYAGKTACFAPFGQPALLLANLYNIELIVGVNPAGDRTRRVAGEGCARSAAEPQGAAHQRRHDLVPGRRSAQAQPVPQYRRGLWLDRGGLGRARAA